MSPRRKLTLLLTPSALSLFIGITLSIIAIVVSCISFAQHSGRFGTFNLHSYINGIGLNNLTALLRTFFTNVRFNSFFFVLFWVLIGFITYSILFIFRGSVDESVNFVQRFHYVHAKPKYMLRQLTIRILLLLAALILWIIFALLFSWTVLPAILNLIDKSISSGESPTYVILSFFITLAMTHLATILMRFTLLKARISDVGKA